MKNYKHFGVMMDISRNAVMKVEELKKFIDVIVKMGYNTLELYAEDTYEIEGEEYLGYMRGRYTAKELKEIDKYCARKGVELIPCVQTLAHFTSPCRLPHYASIFDCDDILLIDEEKTYQFIENIFKSLQKNFKSRLVNIGMDEAHNVGLGRYLKKHGYNDRIKLLSKHLNRVCEIAKKYGFTPHMWSDMFFRLNNDGMYIGPNVKVNQTSIDLVPENIELAYWDYYTIKNKTYANMFNEHLRFNRPIWFAGGVWCWNGFTPINSFSNATMKNVRSHGIENVLITMWGDNGKDCSYFAMLPSLYSVRRFADGVYDMDKIKKEFKDLMGYDYDAYCELDFDEDNKPNSTVSKVNNVAKVALYNDVFMGLMDDGLSKNKFIDFGAKAEKLSAIAKDMGEYSYIFESEAALCKVLSKKAYLGINTRKAYKAGDKETLKALVEDYKFVAEAVGEFRDKLYYLWMKENKPFGWEIQEIRLAGLKARVAECGQRLSDYVDGKLDRIEELEQKTLPFWKAQRLHINNYALLVSQCRL